MSTHSDGPCAGLPECRECREEAEEQLIDEWEEEQRQLAIRHAPERIWLQDTLDGELEQATWAPHKINFDDVEYIRADLKEKP